MAATKKTAAKRPYNRKPKPEVAAATVAQDEDYPKPETDEPVKEETKLVDVEILDLRFMPLYFKAATLHTLGLEGYVWSDLTAPLSVLEELKVEGIRFNHNNKIMFPVNTVEELGTSSEVSTPALESSVKLSFTDPVSMHPPVLDLGNAKYIRIA